MCTNDFYVTGNLFIKKLLFVIGDVKKNKILLRKINLEGLSCSLIQLFG